jgi:hypothetical protein
MKISKQDDGIHIDMAGSLTVVHASAVAHVVLDDSLREDNEPVHLQGYYGVFSERGLLGRLRCAWLVFRWLARQDHDKTSV